LDYKARDPTCTRGPTDSNSYKFNGCFDALIKTVMEKLNFAIIGGVVVGLLQIIGIVFAICVYKAAYYDYK